MTSAAVSWNFPSTASLSYGWLIADTMSAYEHVYSPKAADNNSRKDRHIQR